MIVPVANCNKTNYNSHKKSNMKFSEYLKYLRKKELNQIDETLYLKDWHFQKQSNYKAYDLPIFFEIDWMNEYWDSREKDNDDYRFLYLGPKGSWYILFYDLSYMF